MDRVDGYCERVDESFWGEPVNAVTNAAFLLAALLTARDVGRARGWPPRTPVDIAALVVVLAAIGVGSFAYHTLATGAAAMADTLPVVLFILGYVVVVARRFAGLRRALAWLAAPAFLVLTAAVAALARPLDLPVPGFYLPALLGLAGITGWLATHRNPVPRAYASRFAGITALFATSLTLRQLDGPLCPYWPLGTHFGWHLCNAGVLYLLLRAATRRAAEQVRPFLVTDSR